MVPSIQAAACGERLRKSAWPLESMLSKGRQVVRNECRIVRYAHAREPNAHARELNAHAGEPNAYAIKLNVYAIQPNAHAIVPDGYALR